MNKLELEVDSKKEKYDILFKVETKDNFNYLLYTKNEVNDLGEIIVYAGLLKKIKDKLVIEPINDEDTLANLDTLLMQVKKQAKVEVGE